MSERTATQTQLAVEGVTTTTDAVFYLTRRLQKHYGLVSEITKLPHSKVEAVHVALQINDEELSVQDLTHGTQSYYRRVEKLEDMPFLDKPDIATGTYNEVGLVRYYVWHEGNSLPVSQVEGRSQVAIVGLRSKDGQTVSENEKEAFGFVRIYDFLREELPPPEALQTLLYTRGGNVLHPEFEPELVFEAGAPSALLGERPDSVPGDAHASVNYISPLGATYHASMDHPFKAGLPMGQWLQVCWTQWFLNQENAEVTVNFSEDLVNELYQRIPFDEFNFLGGYVRFYSFATNPDPKEPTAPVNRIAVVGLTHEHKFGFMRIFDSLGLEAPPDKIGALPFDFFTSHLKNSGYGYLNRELVVEAGSPVALIEGGPNPVKG